MKKWSAATLLLTSLSIATAVQSAPITGVVNLTGSAGVSATAVDFFGNGAAGCGDPALGTPGCFLINAPREGDFLTLPVGQPGGTIQDLQGPPISGSISLPSFMTFNNGIVFDLTRVVAGGAPDCATVNGSAANATCTPVINGQVSPFVLTNSSNGANASVFFNVEVNAYLGSSATGFSQYIGAFNTPSAGKNIAGILADIANGKTISAAYSANFVGTNADVPEPDSIALFAIGLIGIVAGSLRSKRASNN